MKVAISSSAPIPFLLNRFTPRTRIRPPRRRRIVRIQREPRVPRDRKLVDRERVKQLLRLDLARHRARRAELREAVGDEEDEHDELAVRGALDLEVAEEGVGAEEVERFVDDVRGFGVGWVGVGGEVDVEVRFEGDGLWCEREDEGQRVKGGRR